MVRFVLASRDTPIGRLIHGPNNGLRLNSRTGAGESQDPPFS